MDSDASAGDLLLRAASMIPLSHYLLAFSALVLVFIYNFLEFHWLGDLLRGLRGDRVVLTYGDASQIYHGVASKCRILHGRYLATPWMASPHLQTAFLNFFGRPPVFTYRRQLFSVRDGGTIALDWFLASDVQGDSRETSGVISKDDTRPIVIVVPGLTSDSASSYIKHLVYTLAKQGWHVVVGNHRGLGGVSITSDCLYNAGWTEDVREVVNHLNCEHPNAPLFTVGTSIGANILVKYLGEDGENTPIAGAASICSPWDLVVCDRFITRKLVQRFYDRVLTIGLQGYARLHQPILSRLANWEGMTKSRSVRDFDHHVTRLVGKFETVDTYYRRCSSANFIGNVSVPLLCISALDDPVCTGEAIPWDECRANKKIVLATTVHGGHLAFFKGIGASSLWWVGAVAEFLDALHASPFMHKQQKAESSAVLSSLESSIDKTPYVNIMENGMVAAMKEDVQDNKNYHDPSDKKTNHDPVPELRAPETSHTENEREICAHSSANKSTHSLVENPEENLSIAKSISDMTAPIKKSIKQLSRRSGQSIWLLAYIAIVTSWPLLGYAFRILFRRKLKSVDRTHLVVS